MQLTQLTSEGINWHNHTQKEMCQLWSEGNSCQSLPTTLFTRSTVVQREVEQSVWIDNIHDMFTSHERGNATDTIGECNHILQLSTIRHIESKAEISDNKFVYVCCHTTECGKLTLH